MGDVAERSSSPAAKGDEAWAGRLLNPAPSTNYFSAICFAFGMRCKPIASGMTMQGARAVRCNELFGVLSISLNLLDAVNFKHVTEFLVVALSNRSIKKCAGR